MTIDDDPRGRRPESAERETNGTGSEVYGAPESETAGTGGATADSAVSAGASPTERGGSSDPGDAGTAAATRPGPADWGDEELPPASEPTSTGARHPVAALGLLALGAAALWGSSRLTWVTVTSADGLTEPRIDSLNGSTWFGALTPLALALLAAIAAVLATRGWLRRLVGVLVALIAAVTAVPALALITGSGATDQRAGDLAGLPGRAQVQEVVTATAPAVFTLCGALAAFAAGLLLTRMPAGTKQLSGKYDNPAIRKAAATQAIQERASGDPLPERVLWDALDAGADPTDATVPAGDTGADEGTDAARAEPDGTARRVSASDAAAPGGTREDGDDPDTTGKSGSGEPGGTS